jgi:hypothetical protein
VDDTVSVTVQLVLPLSVAPDSDRLPPEKLAVPPQVVCGLAPLRFAGSGLAATATPVNCVEVFPLVIVSVSVEVDAVAVVIEVGENAAAMVGAVTTVAVSPGDVVAVLPVTDAGPVADTVPVV